MKKRLLLVLTFSMIGILLSGFAFENEKPKPLLKQIKTSGALPPLYFYSTECTIYRHHIVLQRKAGGIESETTIKISIRGPIDDLINAASASAITPGSGTLGGPQETDIAYNKEGVATVLKQTGSNPETNDAPEAITLVNFLNLNCNNEVTDSNT